MVEAAVSALTVLLQHPDQPVQCFLCTLTALQGNADHVHTGQSHVIISALGEYGLIADADTALIDTDLPSPKPGGAGQHVRLGLLHLIHLYVGGHDFFLGVSGCRVPFQHLGLVGAAVAVLCKDGCRRAVKSSYGITHRQFSSFFR